MTFMPALPSSAARIPPAAPTPTMTTSLFSVAMAHILPSARFGLQADDGQPRERFAALHVRRGEFHLPAGESHQAPSGAALVAAVNRVAKYSFHRVRAHGVEEGGRRGPGELARLALFERGDDLVLLHGGETREGFFVVLAAVRIEGGEPAPIKVLQVGVGARQCQID